MENELIGLKTKRRFEVADRLKNAKEFGDLSENSEYTEAKEEQERVERRIFDLEEIFKLATVIKKAEGVDRVTVGSTVTAKLGEKVFEYKIVGSDETKPEEGKISNESPLGQALLGHKVGDGIAISTIKGEKVYRITKIE